MADITVSTNGKELFVTFLESKILDRHQVEILGRELLQAVPQAVHQRLVLDFTGVTFISSAMITKLAVLNKACNEQQVHLRFCNVPPNVLEVFEIAKLHRLFDIEGLESENKLDNSE